MNANIPAFLEQHYPVLWILITFVLTILLEHKIQKRSYEFSTLFQQLVYANNTLKHELDELQTHCHSLETQLTNEVLCKLSLMDCELTDAQHNITHVQKQFRSLAADLEMIDINMETIEDTFYAKIQRMHRILLDENVRLYNEISHKFNEEPVLIGYTYNVPMFVPRTIDSAIDILSKVYVLGSYRKYSLFLEGIAKTQITQIHYTAFIQSIRSDMELSICKNGNPIWSKTEHNVSELIVLRDELANINVELFLSDVVM